MITVLLNILNILTLVYVLYKNIKQKKDSSLIWYALVSLYFINIPLFFDSVHLLYQRTEVFELNVLKTNPSWVKGTLGNITKISIDSFYFNFLIIATYSCIIGKTKKSKINWNLKLPIKNLSWTFLISSSWLTFVLFIIYNQISLTSLTFIQTGEWYQNRLNIPIVNLILNISIPACSIAALKMLVDRKWLQGISALAPLIIIGAITGSRSQIISIVFFFFYYLVIKLKKINLISITIYTFIIFSFTVLLQSYRGDVRMYPMSKDSSYSELFYSYEIADKIKMKGESTNRLIRTGFIHNDKQYRDVTIELGRYKYKNSLISLHPTVLGWAYLDLEKSFYVIAIFIGLLLGITDKLRFQSPLVINLLMLSFVFAFVAIGVRGSLQYAYSTLVYPLFIMFFLWLNRKYHFFRFKRIR